MVSRNGQVTSYPHLVLSPLSQAFIDPRGENLAFLSGKVLGQRVSVFVR